VSNFLQNFINAISLGSLYALIALGIAVLFGIMQLVNFAHGELIMIGGYTFLLLEHQSFLVIILGTMASVVLLALVMERVAFRPVRSASPPTLFITSFAVSYLIQNIMIIAVGATARAAQLPLTLSTSVTVGSISVARLDLITIAATFVMVAVFVVFLKRTRFGLQMRAASEDFPMSRLLGVRANRVIAGAFAISGLLAAVVALVVTSKTAVLTPDMGQTYVLIGFVATVVGGLGSLVAAGVGGFVVGSATVALQAWLPIGLRPYRDAFVFGLVILILLVRPQGLIVVRSEEVQRV
jgi:branched-chain amino acid transport system permease protein